MRYSTIFAAQLASSAAAVQLVQRDNPRVMSIDIQRKNVIDPIAHDRLRHRATVQQTLDNLEALYFANASIGTPQQNLRLHIDTGSSDLWVNTPKSTLCSDRSDPCRVSGAYNANRSSTYKYVNGVFNISYVDGSGAIGDYVKDTFHFGGKAISDFQFGIGYASTSSEGVLGIGYVANEVAVNRAGLEPYPNLPQKLTNDGSINSNAYSLWLNDLDASTGNILFGGVDTDKYQGKLHSLPVIQQYGVYSQFLVSLTSMSTTRLRGGSQTFVFSDQNLPVLLDSGTTLCYLPDNVVNSLYRTFNVQFDRKQQAAFVDCNLGNSDATVTFGFSGVDIVVRISELVLVAAISRGKEICILGVMPSSGSTAILGDTFLRSAYVVYDLENHQISLAQTNFNATSSNIQEIKAGAQGVPNVEGAPEGVAATATSKAAGVPAVTANPWVGGVALAGAGLMMGFNGF